MDTLNAVGIAINSLKENIEKNVNVDFKAKQTDTENDKLIKNVNNQVLVSVLSPEIRANEQIKRILKIILVTFLIIFLIFQLYTVFALTYSVLNFSFKENSNTETIKVLLTFISAYITSVVIELIAILNYIVKNVFDTSIAELVKIFKEDEENFTKYKINKSIEEISETNTEIEK